MWFINSRPLNPLADRLAVVAALESTTLVTWFEADTPLELIVALRPDVLVKGGDWPPEQIVGAHEVRIAAGLADRARHPLAAWLVDVVDDHARAFGGKARGDAFAESRSSSRDDDHLVLQAHCRLSFACGRRVPPLWPMSGLQSWRKATVLRVVKP